MKEARLEYTFDRDFIEAPLVSIIVTNYNYEQFVCDCLSAIGNQTYRKFECIIVDDCSTDNSTAVVKDFLGKTDDRENFSLVECEINGGQMNAFLKGIESAKGSFVVFVDADDYLFPDFVETHLKAHLNTNFAAALSCSNEIIVDSENRLVAGTYKTIRDHGSIARISKGLPISAIQYENWRDYWQLADKVHFSQPDTGLIYVSSQSNKSREWIWSTTSAIMFRRDVLEIALTEYVRDIRICADFHLLHFCHLVGGSLLIDSSHGCYRLHGSNNFAARMFVSGDGRAGTLQGDVKYSQMWSRIHSEILRQYEEIDQILGENQAVRLIASVSNLKNVGKVRKAFAGKGFVVFIKFVVFYVAAEIRRRIAWVRRVIGFL